MEVEASSFESSEMVANLVGSTPLLSDSWKLCTSSSQANGNAAAPLGFFINRIGDVMYVAFSGTSISADHVAGMIWDPTVGGGGGGNSNSTMVELDCAGGLLFSALHGQEPPVTVHAGFLHLFLSMFHYTNFQAQMFEVLKESKSVVLTGHSIGGVIASLSALWLLSHLQSNDSSATIVNNIVCITFGSPMLGNESLCRAILQQRWGGNFCHVVANHDIVPRLLLEKGSTGRCSYWPFGSYVFCTNEGAICVDNAPAVVKLMHLMLATASPSLSIQDHHLNYGYYVGKLLQKKFLRSGGIVMEGEISDLSYEAGLTLALQSSELASHEPVSGAAKDCLRMAKRMGRTPNLNSANLAIALSKITPLRAQIEWYKASCDACDDRMGYYDSFKLRGASKRGIKVNMNRIKLARFWDDVIRMLDTGQLPDDFHKRGKWVNASHFYKLLVEPLDIAEYYRMGKHRMKGHYLKHGRERRYVIFDRWWKNRGSTAVVGEEEENNKRSRFASLTQDSCFWARVEEAREWLEKVRIESDTTNLSLLWEKIDDFERYSTKIVENKEVSVDVLSSNSSYSLWLKELRALRQSQMHQFSPQFPAAFLELKAELFHSM